MRPLVSDLVDLAYVLSNLFGTDSDVDTKEATYLLNLVTKLTVNPKIFLNSAPNSFCKEWNSSRGLFFGPAAPVPLEESVYKSWTNETGHPLRGVTGLTCGDCAIHIQETLRDFGLDLDPTRFYSHDHLSVILELVGFLLESDKLEIARSFSRDHLDWLEPVLTRTQELRSSQGLQAPINSAILLREIIISMN